MWSRIITYNAGLGFDTAKHTSDGRDDQPIQNREGFPNITAGCNLGGLKLNLVADSTLSGESVIMQSNKY